MNARPRIADYMTRKLTTLVPDMEINHAMHILLERRISAAPVLDDAGQLVGILTKKDCLRAALHASYYREWGDTVAGYMSTDLKTLDVGLDITSAADAFLNSPYCQFPVLENGKLAGLISRTDVLRALGQLWA